MNLLKKITFPAMLFLTLQFLSAWQVEPAAEIYPESVSKSQGLWNREEKVKDHASSYFRFHVNIPEKIKRAVFRANFDDSGAVWVNGKSINPNLIAANIVQGKNLLAFKVTNRYGSARLLFFGEITLESGKKIYLHSTKDVKAAAKVPENWFSLQFDDSKWQPALELGDVRSKPWSRYYDYMPLYTSPEEKAMLDKIKDKAIFVPEDKLSAPAPDAKIVFQGNQPKISLNGKLLDPIFNMNTSMMNIYTDSYLIRFAQHGVNIHTISIHDEFFYRGNGKFDFSYANLDVKVRRILHLDPNAKFRFYIRLGSSNAWYKENPSELIQYASGPIDSDKNEIIERVPRPSPASKKFQEYGKQSIREAAKYINSMPWANKVIMTQIGFGIYGEWHLYGMYSGADTSIPMLNEFKNFARSKYRNIDALRKAWNDPNVTFDTITAPSMQERHPKSMLLNPKTHKKTIDFFYSLAETTSDLLLLLAEEAKKTLPGRLCGAYYGYLLTIHPPEGSNVMIDKVLSSPAIDYLCIPPSYYPDIRLAGGSFLSRTINSAFQRYGKLAIMEDDSRFHHNWGAFDKGERNITTRTPLESQMVMRRNYCNMLLDGSGTQLTDPSGADMKPHYFDDPSVVKGFAEARNAVKKVSSVSKESGNKFAVVIDYRERLHCIANKPPASDLIINTYSLAPMRLYRSGTAFDLITLTDYLASGNKYKTVVFLNLFSLSEKERQAVKAKVRRRGVTAIYMLAPGYVTDKGFSDQAMSDFCGIKLSGADSIPNVKCIDPAALKLKNGTAIKTLTDGSKSIFIPKFPADGKEWQNLLKTAGVRIYTAPGNYFRRHGDIILFHTGSKGQHEIVLPEKSGDVIELFSGKRYKAPVIQVNSQGAGTWLFQFQNKHAKKK